MLPEQRHGRRYRFTSVQVPAYGRFEQRRLVWLITILLSCAGAVAPAHAGAGLFDDAVGVPSYSQAVVERL